MLELVVLIRTANLFKHSCHNLCTRCNFHSDHEYFNELYEQCSKNHTIQNQETL